MTAKRSLALLLSLIMLMSALTGLVSCKPSGTDETTTPNGDSTTTADPNANADKSFVLYENGEWKFKIVRNSKLSTLEESASINLRSALTGIVGGTARIEFGRDNLKDGESYDAEAFEIYYGYTNHPEMQEFFPTVGLGEAAVKVVGNKILVAANSYEGYDRVTALFERLCEENFVDGKITLKASDIESTMVVNSVVNDVPVPDGVKLASSENCEYNQTLLIFDDATPDIFTEYTKKFSGFTEEQNTESAGNYFATYSKDNNLYNVSYSKGDEKLRVIINKNTAPTKYFDKPASVDNKTSPIIIMRGLSSASSTTDYQNGLCMLIRLSDGRFIVIDGGFNRMSDADALYNLLKKNTPTGMKPTVAAWIITHAHGDHHATFASKYVSTYGSATEIQSVIFNPPSAGINKTVENEGAGYKNVISVTQGIPNCEWIRAHVGDRYYIGDAVLDVLYSVDYYYPQTFTYYNTCSLIISIEIAGQRFMMTGDAANASFQKAVKMFGETLKCDIVQVAHHGYGTGVDDGAATSISQAYRYMSPSLVLWPIGSGGYDSVKSRSYNQVLANLPSVEEIIVAREDTHVIELPFKAQ